MHAIAIIPARYASTRFPGKPLVDLCGKTMLAHVVDATRRAQAIDAVIVATDDDRIVDECRRIDVECVMTPSALATGTDRVAYAAELVATASSADVILNVQGDEPLVEPSLLSTLVEAVRRSDADVATPVTVLRRPEDLDNPTICKVTRRNDGTAMYFSRSVIPHVRGLEGAARLEAVRYWKHIGLYAYTPRALARFISLEPHPYELAESLEQLRLLCNGARYECVETEHEPVAVDTPQDAEKVRAIMIERRR